jgi:spermidine synthase
LFETTEDAVKSTISTFFEVFPTGTIWGNTYEGKGHDIVLLGQLDTPRIDLDKIERRVNRPEYSRVAQSLREVGMSSSTDLFTTYAGRKPDLSGWLSDALLNSDRNLRMQYLAGVGLNLDDSAGIYANMLAYRKFPSDLFTSTEGRVELLRNAVEGQ